MYKFVHLRVHTEYSLLDGACKIDDLVKYAKEIGQTSLAITDTSNMYGVVDFYKSCLKHGIRPIIGCEIYFNDPTNASKDYYKIVLLCQDENGYKNLIKLVSHSYTKGFYEKPFVDKNVLFKYNEGLVCLSGFTDSEIYFHLLKDNFDAAKKCAIFYNEVYGQGNFFIEIQNHGILDETKILPSMVRLANETKIPLVCTNNVYYVRKEDRYIKDVLNCIKNGNRLADISDRENVSEEFYIKTYDEMKELFCDLPEAIENTNVIAGKCNFEFDFGILKLPRYTTPKGYTNVDYLKKLSKNGLIKRYGRFPSDNIIKRLNYELEIIINMGYVDYYLIVYDFIKYAKDNDIPVGPGRGSGAGSIIAYIIGITDIDPIKYNLMFERFLNPKRISMPDFDIDFCYERRQEVIDYVINKYGADHVSHIITFGTMAAKAVIRDVGRLMGAEHSKVDDIARLIPPELKITIEKSLNMSDDLRTIYNTDDEVRNILDVSQKIEGYPRHTSTHAAGIIITDKKVDEYVPLAKNDDVIVTQYPMTTLEELGLLKMDFLGLRTLTVIRDCEKRIRKKTDFNINKISLHDKQTFEMLSKGISDGIFQLESKGVKRLMYILKPTSIEDIMAIISLHRPGPLESGAVEQYIKNKNNLANLKYAHESLKPILESTYGCIVYQEQVMQIFKDLGGYSYEQADIVRKAMSKKMTDVMEKEREKFIHGCIQRNIGKKLSIDLFDDMLTFSAYAFNKSHAVCYATLAYRTAYLKSHYKLEFMSSLLTSVMDNPNKLVDYINECARLGIKIYPPDINKSMEYFEVEGGGIRFAIPGIKGIGKIFTMKMVKERQSEGCFTSLKDFCFRMMGKDVTKRMVEILIKIGAFDCVEPNRKCLMEKFSFIFDSVGSDTRSNVQGQINLFNTGNEDMLEHDNYQENCSDYSIQEKLNIEKELIGTYVSGNPIDDYNIFKYPFDTVASIDNSLVISDNVYKNGDIVIMLCLILKVKSFLTKNNKSMAFLTASDKTGEIRVILFPETYRMIADILRKDNIFIIRGEISLRDGQSDIKCINIMEASAFFADKHNNKRLYIKLNPKLVNQILQLLIDYPGYNKVYFYFEDKKKVKVLPNKYNVRISDELINKIKTILGDENVAFKN